MRTLLIAAVALMLIALLLGCGSEDPGLTDDYALQIGTCAGRMQLYGTDRLHGTWVCTNALGVSLAGSVDGTRNDPQVSLLLCGWGNRCASMNGVEADYTITGALDDGTPFYASRHP